MFDSLINFLQSGLPQNLLSIFAGYIVALWLMFCIWVFVDAKKRYKNFLVAIGFFIATFILNFPALVFYLIVRPEIEDTFDFGGDTTNGGVNVPIANFLNANGEVVLGFNMTVSPQLNKATDMNIDITWDSEKTEMQVKGKDLEIKKVEEIITVPTKKFQLPKLNLRRPVATVDLTPIKAAVNESATKLKSKTKSTKA